MDEISVFIRTDDLTQPETIEAYMTGRRQAKLEAFAN
jgi:hypothetical protein